MHCAIPPRRITPRMRRLTCSRVQRTMKPLLCLLAVIAAPLLGLPGCQTVEGTGRKQFILPGFGDQTMAQMGADAYKQALEGQTINTDRATNDMVKRVGMRIAEATNHP